MSAALKEALTHGSVQDGHIPPLATMFEDVYKDMPPHLHEQMRQAAERREAEHGHHDHDPGPAFGDGRDAGARRERRRLRRGRGLLRRRVPLHRGPAGQVRQAARVRRADRRRRHRRHRHRHGRLRPAAGGRGPVRRLLLPGVGPDRLRGRAAALPLGRRLHGAGRHPHALRRRHLRRADAQPEPGGAVHACLRAAHRDAEQPVRRQGAADRGHRVRRPGDLPGAQAHLQRPLRRPPRPAGGAVVGAPEERGARGPLHGAAGVGRAWCGPATT